MQIAKTLQLSKSKVYAFLNDVFEGGNTMFKVIKIGTSIRVEKSSFDEWLHAATK
jgi:predicted DNA-binding transcriptional regulator AlpA